ncbi:BON domain-containing protein [Cupriavidus sp. IDO]|uniref:BON domain-containing protein n=1 Tax=Cupriavidus sp. IDO TaxID=1539142 RepID=UPI00057953C4|nr:BON domain-containing protein [Cupriavidus sp. IDO]KWR89617.1 transporter [Cupriavidus sp. IDO]
MTGPRFADATGSPDQTLDTQVRERITEAFGGIFPAGVTVAVADRRVLLNGCVEDQYIAQRIEKAAAVSPGVLGVHNALRTRQPAPVEPPGQPPSSGADANPAGRPSGQINHKV